MGNKKKETRYTFEHTYDVQAIVKIPRADGSMTTIEFSGGVDLREDGKTYGIFSTVDKDLADDIKKSGGFGTEKEFKDPEVTRKIYYTPLRKKVDPVDENKKLKDEVADLKAQLAKLTGGDPDKDTGGDDGDDGGDGEDGGDGGEGGSDDGGGDDEEVVPGLKTVSDVKEYLRKNHGAAAAEVATKAAIKEFLTQKAPNVSFPDFDLDG